MNQFFLRLIARLFGGVGLVIFVGSFVIGFLLYTQLPGDSSSGLVSIYIIIGTILGAIQGAFIAAVGQLLVLFMHMVEMMIQIEMNTRPQAVQGQ